MAERSIDCLGQAACHARNIPADAHGTGTLPKEATVPEPVRMPRLAAACRGQGGSPGSRPGEDMHGPQNRIHCGVIADPSAKRQIAAQQGRHRSHGAAGIGLARQQRAGKAENIGRLDARPPAAGARGRARSTAKASDLPSGSAMKRVSEARFRSVLPAGFRVSTARPAERRHTAPERGCADRGHHRACDPIWRYG